MRQVCLKHGRDKAQYSHTAGSEAKRMAINQINWGQFLQPGSELPPDVTFRVIEEQPKKDEGDDHGVKTSKVPAHKFLLAGVSPVFRKLFFGPLKTTEDTVDIKDTTIKGFTTMIRSVKLENLLPL